MRNHQEQQVEDQEAMVSMDTRKNPNLETTHQHHHTLPSPPSSQGFKRTHHQHNLAEPVLKKTHEVEGFIIKNHKESSNAYAVTKKTSCSSLAAGGGGDNPPPPASPEAAATEMVVEESGRERLKRHRIEMGGRVWIPDIWGQEDLLKDWIDCTVFDSSLGNNSIMSARAALVQEGRSTLRIDNRC